MTKKTNQYKRKKYLIQKVFQAKFIVIFLLLLILGSIISGVILYSKTNTYLGYDYGKAHSKIKETGDILRPVLFISYGISIVLIGIATIFLTIFISHKVAGPLYRFERSAEEIGKGNLRLVTKIRDSDQAKGLADAFSRMTKDLREKILEIDSNSQNINRVIEEIKWMISQETLDVADIQKKIGDLDQMSKVLRQSLQYFKL
ncbi:methyl-accepting chemotaxis protein [bacterium]|nr:methyl-accepting chemotaxis protein [bacterium]